MEHKRSAQEKPGSETPSPAGTQGSERPRQPAQEEWRARVSLPLE